MKKGGVHPTTGSSTIETVTQHTVGRKHLAKVVEMARQLHVSLVVPSSAVIFLISFVNRVTEMESSNAEKGYR